MTKNEERACQAITDLLRKVKGVRIRMHNPDWVGSWENIVLSAEKLEEHIQYIRHHIDLGYGIYHIEADISDQITITYNAIPGKTPDNIDVVLRVNFPLLVDDPSLDAMCFPKDKIRLVKLTIAAVDELYHILYDDLGGYENDIPKFQVARAVFNGYNDTRVIVKKEEKSLYQMSVINGRTITQLTKNNVNALLRTFYSMGGNDFYCTRLEIESDALEQNALCWEDGGRYHFCVVTPDGEHRDTPDNKLMRIHDAVQQVVRIVSGVPEQAYTGISNATKRIVSLFD